MHTRRASLVVSSVAAALMLGVTPVVAADKTHDNTQAQVAGQKKPADARSARDAEKAWEQTHRASKVIGTDIVNAKGEKVGKVKDLILDDPASGRVSRVVVSVGGVGGLGDKLFAVPYNALQPDQAKDRLVLNADSDLAHAFDDNNWQVLAKQPPSGSASSASASSPPPVSSNATASTPATDTSATMSPATASSSTNSGSASNTVITAPGTSDTTTTK